VLLSNFDFDLPEAQIAQSPAERGTSRLLVLDRRAGVWTHQHISDLPSLLTPGDVLVVNDTRVVPARLLGHRDPSGGRVECLLLRHLEGERWDALLHPGQKMKPGTHARFGEGPLELQLEVLSQHTFGRRTIRLWRTDAGDVDEAIDRFGHIPLPPYIKRPDSAADRERYQTVYARARGSVAAPTAGLHLTPELLTALRARGVQRADITLHVGYGTFSPIRVEEIEAHTVDPEVFDVTPAAAAIISRAQDEARRIVAVGTTTTRTLESVAREHGGRVMPAAGETALFIYPGFQFKVLGGLLTNFHLPQSSLLVLVCAFAGRELVLDAYRDAVREGYRFYSYGDAMIVI
jgi:S-adenosylmethionine:tRNA ribosyltransferase-isomerase